MKKIGTLILAIGLVLGITGCKAEVSNVELTGITVTPPTKITYEIGEPYISDGLKVTAVYSDKSTKDVTEQACVGALDSSTAGEKTVSVSYTENEITVYGSFKVTVNEKPAEPETPPAEPETPQTPPKPTTPKNKVTGKSYMDADGNIKIGETSIPKTSEVIVIPEGTTAEIAMEDDSSWSSYYNGEDNKYKGVFLKDRKVKLDSFVMSQYEVTQKLYNEVMGNNPSEHNDNPYGREIQENRPVEKVSWYEACAFCNELTKKTMTESDCVYYSDSDLKAPYTATDASSNTIPYIAYNTETKKWTKTGYRLPTEAEWEFAARGGNPKAPEWSYAYAGSQTKKEASKFIEEPDNDDELESYAWYYNNADSKTHEVGLKEKNKLNLYDMSGNVREWCYDSSSKTANINDSAYKTSDRYVQNPLGAARASYSIYRGGYYNSPSSYCSVSIRQGLFYDSKDSNLGFSVCRSTQ